MITDKRGFTVIELVMVLVLVGIIAAVVSPMLTGGTSAVTVGAMARKVADDIRYAQSLALVRSNLDTPAVTNPAFLYSIRFNVADASCPGANNYTIVNDADGNGTWGENPNGAGLVESARLSSTGAEYFCVRLDSGDYKGFSVSADFGGSTPGIVSFDNFGIPYDSDGTRLAAAKTITVSSAGESMTVTVTPNTGRVSIQ